MGDPDLEVKVAKPEIQVSGNATVISEVCGKTSALSCAVLPESNLLAVGWLNGEIQVRNAETFEEMRSMERSQNLPATFLSGCTSNDARHILLASYASGETVIWDAEDGFEMGAISEDRQALVNDFSNDNTSFAVGGSDAKISLYDTEKQELSQTLQGSMDPEVMDGHIMRVFSVRFHPHQKFELISGGWDDTIQFWDVREPFSRRKIRGPHICGAGIEFFEDNKIITASWTRRNPLQMWDYRTGKLIENIKPDDLKCFLYCCQYVEDDSILLVGGSHRNILRVVDTNTLRSTATFRNLPGAVYFAKELPQSDLFSYSRKICFCSNSSIYLAEVDT